MFQVSGFMIQFNLLPPQEKKELEIAEISGWIVSFGAWLLVVLIIFALFCLSIYFYLSILLKAQNRLIETEKSRLETQQLSQFEEEIQVANQNIDQIYNLQKNFEFLTPTLEKLAKAAPPGIYLTAFSYKSGTHQIDLSGRADKRDQFLLFQKALEESAWADELNSPISNLVKQTDIDFHLTFKVRGNSNSFSIPKLPVP